MNIASARFKAFVAAATLCAGIAPAAQAQIVKCVDKAGRIEFASSCPPGSKQADTGVSNRPASAPAAAKDDAKGNPAAAKSMADREAEFRKRQADQKEAEGKSAQRSAEEAERQRICQSAQGNLQAIKNRQRMYRTDPKTGERTVFEEADFVREQAVAERVAADSCK